MRYDRLIAYGVIKTFIELCDISVISTGTGEMRKHDLFSVQQALLLWICRMLHINKNIKPLINT
jgi:hypothetical protein